MVERVERQRATGPCRRLGWVKPQSPRERACSAACYKMQQLLRLLLEPLQCYGALRILKERIQQLLETI